MVKKFSGIFKNTLSNSKSSGFMFVGVALMAFVLVSVLIPAVNTETVEAIGLENYKDMMFKEGITYFNPTPFINGLPQECASGGYLCYYEWGGS